MFKNTVLPLFSAIALFFSCNAFTSTPTPTPTPTLTPDPVMYGNLDTAYFAAGCFWCEEAIFERLKGVKEAESGYAGGQKPNPTYEEVCTHTTGHAESVRVIYDPAMVSYQSLLEVYFASQDPTQVNGQGPDIGDSYRSIIFYCNDDQKKQAEAYKQKLNDSGKYDKPIAASIEPYKIFYMAEDYHQNYERNHPTNPYVQRVSIPRIQRMEALFPNLLKPGQK